MLASEIAQADTRLPAEMVVSRESGSPKRPKELLQRRRRIVNIGINKTSGISFGYGADFQGLVWIGDCIDLQES